MNLPCVDYKHLDDLLEELQKSTKVILCFYKDGIFMSFFVLLERLGALNMVSLQGIFYENLINSTQW